jgi:hypothetical protein
MARTNDLEAGGLATLTPAEPSRTYTVANDRSDRGLLIPLQPLPAMQSSTVRNRGPHLQSSMDADQSGEGSVSSGIEIIPTSSENSEQLPGIQTQTSIEKQKLKLGLMSLGM